MLTGLAVGVRAKGVRLSFVASGRQPRMLDVATLRHLRRPELTVPRQGELQKRQRNGWVVVTDT